MLPCTTKSRVIYSIGDYRIERIIHAWNENGEPMILDTSLMRLVSITETTDEYRVMECN